MNLSKNIYGIIYIIGLSTRIILVYYTNISYFHRLLTHTIPTISTSIIDLLYPLYPTSITYLLSPESYPLSRITTHSPHINTPPSSWCTTEQGYIGGTCAMPCHTLQGCHLSFRLLIANGRSPSNSTPSP